MLLEQVHLEPVLLGLVLVEPELAEHGCLKLDGSQLGGPKFREDLSA
jgi:hypothetical protein